MSSLPHPLDIEVLDFEDYALVIDARTAREHQSDHIPGSVNLPVVTDAQYDAVNKQCSKSCDEARLLGVQHGLANVATHLPVVRTEALVGDKVLVYSNRGGPRSKLWADALTTIGYEVSVLGGGWAQYRKWVVSALDSLPRHIDWRVLVGRAGTGKTRLLGALLSAGEQVLDLEELANHRGTFIGGVPGVRQPEQHWFDSVLLARLREFDYSRPVWVEAKDEKIGSVKIPSPLLQCLHIAPTTAVRADMGTRCEMLSQDFRHFSEHPEKLSAYLTSLIPGGGSDLHKDWNQYCTQGEFSLLAASVLTHHFDPISARLQSTFQPPGREVHLLAINDESLASAAASVIAANS